MAVGRMDGPVKAVTSRHWFHLIYEVLVNCVCIMLVLNVSFRKRAWKYSFPEIKWKLSDQWKARNRQPSSVLIRMSFGIVVGLRTEAYAGCFSVWSPDISHLRILGVAWRPKSKSAVSSLTSHSVDLGDSGHFDVSSHEASWKFDVWRHDLYSPGAALWRSDAGYLCRPNHF
jgi:hypothetical protein